MYRILALGCGVLVLCCCLGIRGAYAGVHLHLRGGHVVTADSVTQTGATIVATCRRRGIQLSRTIPRDQVIRFERSADTVALPVSGWGERGCCSPVRSISWNGVSPMGIPTRSVVIGVREDPLNAYRGAVSESFPDGVPTLERGFVRELMRYRAGGFAAGAGRMHSTPPPAPELEQIRALDVDAAAVSGSGKTDLDALRVRLIGRGDNDRLVIPRGTARITLWGARQREQRLSGDQVVWVPEKIERIAEWSVELRPEHRRGSTSEVLLRLPKSIPDQDVDWFALGEIHVKLTIPGHGVLEVSRGDIPLRRESTLRNALYRESGQRFFPGEGTARPRRAEAAPLRRQSTLTPVGRILPVHP